MRPKVKQPDLIYHLNYKTGDPDVCFERGCDVPKRDHFTSEEAAWAAYEEHMKAYTFANVMKQSPRIPLFNPSMLD